MDPNQIREANEAAFRKLKPTIDQTYPPGRMVAIYDGKIVADATGIEELIQAVEREGINPREALAVESGKNYSEYVVILPLG
jgi:hypothetical protein